MLEEIGAKYVVRVVLRKKESKNKVRFGKKAFSAVAQRCQK